MKIRGAQIRLLIILTAVSLRFASPLTADASYFVLAAYALFGGREVIHALALSWLFSMLNPALAAESSLASIGRYVVLLAALISVSTRSGLVVRLGPVRKPVFWTVLLGIFLICHSLLLSPVKDVSVLKAISWTVAASTLMAAWSGLTAGMLKTASREVFGGLVMLLIASVPLLLSPIGYLRNGSGFQGLMNHPQAFGATMALLGAWAVSRMLSDKKLSWWLLSLSVACLFMIILSEARTAGLALVIGIFAAIIVAAVFVDARMRSTLPGLLNAKLYVIVFMASLAALVNGDVVADRVSAFVSKSDRVVVPTLLAAYERSRGDKIAEMWTNIKAKPLQGNGFGISSSPTQMDIQRDPVFGLPMGASVEKGVMPIAILEEVGVVGLLLVVLWLLMLLRRVTGGENLSSLSVFFVALLLNLGESVLFSAGGMGLLVLIFVGWASAQKQLSTLKSFHA